VTGALNLGGIRLPTSTNLSDGLTVLNRMLASWSAERLLVPYVTDESFTLTAGTAVYTIGSSGTFNTTRPIRIVDGYVRDTANVDTPVDPTMSLDEWARIADKATRGRPERLYYAPEYPLGKIHLDLPPDLAYTLRLWSWKPLSSIATLDTTVSLPGEYEELIVLSLAVKLAPGHNVALDATVIQQAAGAHATLRTLNAPVPAPARHDPALTWALLR
jgi:hypothetical protein